MSEFVLNQIIVPVAQTLVSGCVIYLAKRYIEFLNSKKDYIDHQKALVKAQIGETEYNHVMTIVHDVVMEVEQIGKECNWDGLLKKSKAIDLISARTNLTEEAIISAIKTVVGSINLGRSSADYTSAGDGTVEPSQVVTEDNQQIQQ